MAINWALIAKVGGLVCTGVGALLTAYAGKKENDKTLKKLVEETLKNK
jgi:hypothetical protein